MEFRPYGWDVGDFRFFRSLELRNLGLSGLDLALFAKLFRVFAALEGQGGPAAFGSRYAEPQDLTSV